MIILSVPRFFIQDGKRGQVTKMLLDKWSENVGIDVVAQIKAFNKETENFSGSTPYRFG